MRFCYLSLIRSYGIRGLALHLFRSYLEDGTQIYQIDCSKSTPKFLNCGVPRGTNLDPLLFLLYINDLPRCLNFSHSRMHADDTSITYAGKDFNEIDYYLNKDLKSVNTWLSSNKLTLNLTKTEFLIITSIQGKGEFTCQTIRLLPLIIFPLSRCLQQNLSVYLYR